MFIMSKSILKYSLVQISYELIPFYIFKDVFLSSNQELVFKYEVK